jgi:hypothetical protein
MKQLGVTLVGTGYFTLLAYKTYCACGYNWTFPRVISEEFTKTSSTLTKILQTTHNISGANCYLLQVKPLILKLIKKYNTHINTQKNKTNTSRNTGSKYANPKNVETTMITYKHLKQACKP